MSPGGRGCSELRWHHCTPAWARERDSVSKKLIMALIRIEKPAPTPVNVKSTDAKHVFHFAPGRLQDSVCGRLVVGGGAKSTSPCRGGDIWPQLSDKTWVPKGQAFLPITASLVTVKGVSGLGAVAQVCNPRTLGAEVGGSRGQEIETILVNMVKPCLY